MRNSISRVGEAGKVSPLMIILIVLGAGVVMIGLIVVLAGAFVFHKAQEAGLDSDLLSENPGIAVAKMAAAMNPNLEVIAVDEESGKITLYDKEADKQVTLDLEQVANGNIKFETSASGAVAGEMTQPDGTASVESSVTAVEYGAAKLPPWIKVYPGASVQGGVSGRSAEGTSGHAVITTGDSPDQVSGFYEKSLKQEGLQVSTVKHQGPSGSGAMINAEGGDDGRRATVIVSASGQETTANIAYSTEN